MKNKLIKLFLDNAQTVSSYKIEANVDSDEATVYVYEAIGDWYGISAEQFVKDIAAINAKTIHLRIDSPGGDVFDARSMWTALKQHKAKVIAHIDGLAASAATTLALAADEIEISDGGFFMIHNAWVFTMGNAAELIKTADLLSKVDDAIIKDYANKTGQDIEQIKTWMAEETWFSAQEAKEHGFVDRVYEGEGVENRWNLSAYNNAPKPKTPEKPIFDKANIERRLALRERIA